MFRLYLDGFLKWISTPKKIDKKWWSRFKMAAILFSIITGVCLVIGLGCLGQKSDVVFNSRWQANEPASYYNLTDPNFKEIWANAGEKVQNDVISNPKFGGNITVPRAWAVGLVFAPILTPIFGFFALVFWLAIFINKYFLGYDERVAKVE